MQPSIDDWVRENLRYDPETGFLWWVKQNVGSGPRRDFNNPAGRNNCGYLIIDMSIKVRSTIRAHRVAWFLYYGVWPKNEVDHINNIRKDNRIVNLREATRVENMGNMKIREGGTSKYKGVHRYKTRNNWRAEICVNNKRVFLGYYDNENDAALAYNKAALEYFGEYAKINEITPLTQGT